MNPVGLTNAPVPGQPDSPAKIRDAAEQFEALLIAQILHSAKETSETKSDAATDFAEQQMANCLAHSGGIGLAAMIADSLRRSG